MTATTRGAFKGGLLVLVLIMVVTGCGGTSGLPVSSTVVSSEGAVATSGTVRVKGIAKGVRVRVTGLSGLTYEAEADARGRFTLMLPDNDTYVMGFEHDNVMGSHFAGHMAFDCGTGNTDRLSLSGARRTINLGKITMRNDGGFARPRRNPLKQLDSDGDGIPDSRDSDTNCMDLGDSDGDGFYDDDMDHDGYHDDDTDGDGYHDCEMSGMGHGDQAGSCGMTRTPARTPMPMHTPGMPMPG